MKTIALTGGIATGKSTFVEFFRELEAGAVVFDCDGCVHELLTKSVVAQKIAESLGADLVDSAGRLERARLRERVFSNSEIRRVLESILHPLVRTECRLAQEAAEAASAEFFLADVPLLYESAFPLARHLDVVVACDPALQHRRLLDRNGYSTELSGQMIAAQLPILEKTVRSSVVIWNGGTRDALRRQTETFLLWMKKTHRI